ncbi:MAG: FAD-dependent oxidoreductase [Clostridium sp.]|nr:FAD-dependent oxidoreductase [Acetatifactor muris]MCM1527558.1 FAD-dependent oxidoreductase [Bacteroides sp.]MCM1563800.1 FAD-dependent oxidoreductase [Clostridium sp.]
MRKGGVIDTDRALYDVIVIGGGPAGLTSAIYLARARYRVLVVEKDRFGGQITITEEIVNYPGVEKAGGAGLTETMYRQARHFGAEFLSARVTEIEIQDKVKKIKTDSGEEYQALGIVLAVGAGPRKIGFQGEKEFQGRGVAYCATCDGEFFTGKEVLVIGGGFAAVEESIFLTKYASKVTVIVRDGEFSCAAGVAEKLKSHPEITVHFHTELQSVSGERFVEHAVLRNNETGEEWAYDSADGQTFGVFVFAGYEPATKWLHGMVSLNEQGYILTDREQATDVAGVYAAGDVCVKGLRQVVTAVGDGAVAATSLEHYVSKLREELGMPKAESQRNTEEEQGEGMPAAPGFLDENLRENLRQVFARFQNRVTVAAVVNGSGASAELESFVRELEGMDEKVEILVEHAPEELPYLEIRRGDVATGIRYYSVPGGHEFNSFVLALYNTAGPGRELSEGARKRIAAFQKSHNIRIMTTLSCTNCPDVVAGTQQIAVLSDKVSAWMYDLAKFPEYRDKYGIMAVPCMILDDDRTYFGRKSMEELIAILEQT